MCLGILIQSGDWSLPCPPWRLLPTLTSQVHSADAEVKPGGSRIVLKLQNVGTEQLMHRTESAEP